MPLKREKKNCKKRSASNTRLRTEALGGGVGETRTLAPEFTRPTPLAGAPRHQLEYYSKLLCGIKIFNGGEDGIRTHVPCGQTVFKTASL